MCVSKFHQAPHVPDCNRRNENFQCEKKKVFMVPISPGMLRITKRYRGKSKDLRQNNQTGERQRWIPIGPLMREHRLIEHMIGLMKSEVSKIAGDKQADPVFIETAVDFFRLLR